MVALKDVYRISGLTKSPDEPHSAVQHRLSNIRQKELFYLMCVPRQPDLFLVAVLKWSEIFRRHLLIVDLYSDAISSSISLERGDSDNF